MKSRQQITEIIRDGWIDKWELENDRSPHYVSFIKTQDIKSQGSKSRTPDFASPGQDRDLLSTNERHFFYRLRFSKKFASIKEQFPLLPLERAAAIAKQLNLRYSTYPYTSNVQVVMTSDFYCIALNGQKVVYSIKDEVAHEKLSAKQQQNVDNKLKIERAFWETQGVKWHLIKSRTLKNVFTQNLEQLFPAYELKLPLSMLLSRWLKCLQQTIENNHSIALRDAVETISQTLSISYPDSVFIFQHCVWHKKILVDLHKRLRFECLISEFNLRVNPNV